MKFEYARLIEAMSGAVQGDRERLAGALRACDAEPLFSHAARHKCAPLLLRALAEQRIHDAALRPLQILLQQYAGKAAAGTNALSAQIDFLIDAFSSRGIPHVLLKTAGRFYAGDPSARWTYVADLDVLVPPERAEEAAQALLDRGYTWQGDAATVEGYRRYHHHLAPLDAPDGGKTVEIHTALAYPMMFTLESGWKALRPYLTAPRADRPLTYTLNGTGRALHYMIHGIGLYRLADAVLLAQELRRDEALRAVLLQIAQSDRLQRVPMLAVLHLAARIAGRGMQSEPQVRDYVRWAIAREDLPPFYRGRAHLVDAWFANGGRINGPATAFALPPKREYGGRLAPLTPRFKAIAGRVLAGIVVWQYGLLHDARQ